MTHVTSNEMCVYVSSTVLTQNNVINNVVVSAGQMGRKCTTVYDGKSCSSGYRNSKFTGKIFGFPPDTAEEGLIERKW